MRCDRTIGHASAGSGMPKEGVAANLSATLAFPDHSCVLAMTLQTLGDCSTGMLNEVHGALEPFASLRI
jgi:hypothetical protein